MVWFLIILSLSVYFIIFYLTKKELFGLLASLIVLNLSIIVNNSRNQFEFIPLAAICTLAAFFLIKDMRLANRVNCLVFSLLMYISVLIHPSAFFYFSFFYAYLFFIRKNRVNYAVMLVFFLIIATWNYSFFIPWTQAKYNNDQMHYGFLTFFLKNIKSVNPAEFYVTLANFFDRRLTRFFVQNIFIASASWLISRFFFRNKSIRIFSGFKFIFLFFIYNIFFYAVSGNNINCFIMLFVLYALVFVLLLEIIWSALPRFSLIPKAYTMFCCLFVFNSLLSGAGQNLQAKPLKEDPILIGKNFSAFDESNERLRFSVDMVDISDILFYLDRKNKQQNGDKELRLLNTGVTLYNERDGIRVGRIYPVYSFWGRLDDREVLYGIQAFYSGVKVDWKDIIMYLYPEEFRSKGPHGTFNSQGQDGRLIEESASNQLKEDLSGYSYIFFTVLNQSTDEDEIWQTPAEGVIIDKIKEINRPIYDKFFSNISLFTKRRIHKNIFLYVFEINQKPVIKAL